MELTLSQTGMPPSRLTTILGSAAGRTAFARGPMGLGLTLPAGAANGESRTRHDDQTNRWVSCLKSQPRIHRLTLKRQHSKDAFVDSTKRLPSDEPLERLDAEGELSQGERTFCVQPTGS